VKLLNQEFQITILYTTHYMEEAQELSHRIGIIDHGEIIALGTQAELTEMVGQFDTVCLYVPEASPEVVSQLGQIANVERSEAIDGEVRLLARNGRTILPEAIRVLNTVGLPLNSLEIKEPNLEAVFLHLTGRALRD
jgi:ABC-2 type transport system ATP-binding protein